jgi:peptidoglycan-N-acetylglucosamine deacetylase
MMGGHRPVASLSLDLDNDWSYRRTRGLDGWEQHPSYLDVVVPRAVEWLSSIEQRITFFVVGIDAEGADARWIRLLAEAGHEVGNHSHTHRPWMDRDPVSALHDEIARAEDAIGAATGSRPTLYRGPGYSLSPDLLEVLVARGYTVDASSLPTWIGPLARATYFRAASFSDEERALRKDLFGHGRDALRPLRPYRWLVDEHSILEIPVTTLPLGRIPIHFSYLLMLAGIDERLAGAYWQAALRLALLRRVEPSLLLHPLDLVDGTEIPQLAFFPGMATPTATKLRLLTGWLRTMQEHFDVVTIGAHADHLGRRALPSRPAEAAAARNR